MNSDYHQSVVDAFLEITGGQPLNSLLCPWLFGWLKGENIYSILGYWECISE